MRDNLEAMRDKNTEAHTGHVQHPLCHHKAHWEEEVGRRNERQNDERQGLREENRQTN